MYEDIINLPHHVSKTHPQMSMLDRAAQFSPFAALTGYDSAINEAGRLTCKKIILSEDAQESLDWKMQQITSRQPAPTVSLTYFVADSLKDGGSYLTHIGQIKRVDDVERGIYMSDGAIIPLDDVYELSAEGIQNDY